MVTYNYKPVFEPRFCLRNNNVVGFDLRIKKGKKVLTNDEALHLVISGCCTDLINTVASHLAIWRERIGTDTYISWEISSQTDPKDISVLLQVLSTALPLQNIEIMFDARDMTAEKGLNKCENLFFGLKEHGIRRGIYHSRPRSFDIDKFCRIIDVYKISKGTILEIKDTLLVAKESYDFLEKLKQEKIDIVAIDLFCKDDVTSIILMGVPFGQGYYMSSKISDLHD